MEVSLDEFKSFRKNSEACVIFFTAKWCNPCKRIYPIFDDMAVNGEPRIKMIRIGVELSDDVSQYCQIEKMPTFVFYYKGKRIDELRFTGAEKQKLVDNYNRLIDLLPDTKRK